MSTIEACPGNIIEKSRELRPGDTLLLEGCDYLSPVVLDGIGGTAKNPITIRSNGKARFTSGEKFEDARKRINGIVRRRQQAGYYPSIGQTADESWLILRNCRHIRVEKLAFVDCWPGSIYVDECQNVTIHRVRFRGGTIAIGLNGRTTREITIRRCTWKQDTSKTHKLWRKITWDQVHGHSNNAAPGDDAANVTDDDYRLFDGDFVRAWTIAGNVKIIGNAIFDAFNAIHFFNTRRQKERLDADGKPIAGPPQGSANVLIEHNLFVRIKDNAIEPEEAWWNWVVRHNFFFEFYRLFSLEMKYGGYFYAYGNLGAQITLTNTERGRGSLIKLGGTNGAGPFYFFHNSWQLHERIVTKGALRGFRHFNNLVSFNVSKGKAFNGNVFGKSKLIDVEAPLARRVGAGFAEGRQEFEGQRFTVLWDELGIESDGDTIESADFPYLFQFIGMDFGPLSNNRSTGFVRKALTPFGWFTSRNKDPCAAPFVETPFGPRFRLRGDAKRGAIQADGKRFELSREFGWLD